MAEVLGVDVLGVEVGPDQPLRRIRAPTLVLWTTKDPSGPVDEAERG
jgi:pimeloyl-ACP methyl ester carboxylesterase